MMQLIIDPGHGGKDPGAVAFGQKEKDWTLEVSLYQLRRFKELGLEVEVTRFDDSTLEPATRISRVKNKAALCISNHFNAFNGSVRGIEVIHSIHTSGGFAREVAQNLVDKTGLPLRRVFSRTLPTNNKQDYYFMHRMTGNTQTLIIEYGFIDHPLDHQHFKKISELERAAETVVEAVCKELGVLYLPVQSSQSKGPVSVPLIQSDKPAGVKRTRSQGDIYSGKILRSIHKGHLRFYSKPSWKDEDVYGYMKENQLFPIIRKKVTVGKGEQFQVENRKGEVYYVTAHPKFVAVQ